ncbi:MAG: hypothetical protein FJ104_06680 [Deltaproteobacteria bacterium]|nr:hypothetical protein [Deltaproteobacteria bacterium]
MPALPYQPPEGAPIAATPGGWTYVPLDGSACGNGEPTGIAVRSTPGARRLLVFLQGGGACWDPTTCLVLRSAVNLTTTVGQAEVLAAAGEMAALFDPVNPVNPFREHSYVFVPYCTGDMHLGDAEVRYPFQGSTVSVSHRGGRNLELALGRLAATFPDVERVALSGISAGGYGATFNWWRAQGAFPRARVDVWDDAGLPVDAPDARFATMVDVWKAALPPGCAGCAERPAEFLSFYADHLVAPRRYALTGFLGDAVIGAYFGLGPADIEAQLLTLRDAMASNQRALLLTGTKHSVTGEGLTQVASDGASPIPWMQQFVGDDPAWAHAGP